MPPAIGATGPSRRSRSRSGHARCACPGSNGLKSSGIAREASVTPPSGKGEWMFDVVVRGGTLVDGTGAPARSADIGVRDGTIAEVGALDDPSATTEIDASGCIVT